MTQPEVALFGWIDGLDFLGANTLTPIRTLGAVIEDHAALDHAGHGVDHGDGGVSGTEEAERAYGDELYARTNPQAVRACKWNLQASDGPKIRKA